MDDFGCIALCVFASTNDFIKKLTTSHPIKQQLFKSYQSSRSNKKKLKTNNNNNNNKNLQLHDQVNFAIKLKHVVQLDDVVVSNSFENVDFHLYHVFFAFAFESVDDFYGEFLPCCTINTNFDFGERTAK